MRNSADTTAPELSLKTQSPSFLDGHEDMGGHEKLPALWLADLKGKKKQQCMFKKVTLNAYIKTGKKLALKEILERFNRP